MELGITLYCLILRNLCNWILQSNSLEHKYPIQPKFYEKMVSPTTDDYLQCSQPSLITICCKNNGHNVTS